MRLSQHSSKAGQRGLTLIEIIIVLGLVSTVIALLGSRLIGGVDRANVKQAKVALGQIATSLEDYRADCNTYPTTEVGLKALVEDPGAVCPDWLGPYTKKENILDPWKNEFAYESEDGNYTLKSYGADKRPGGSGVDKDLEAN